jgi:uncharacterized coiled-coil protein SlyX
MSLAAPALLADVKTQQRTAMKFEGFLGSMLTRAAGGSDGTTFTISVKGDRMSRLDQNGGQIVDLAEERIHTLDLRRKEYRTMTFAELRKQLAEAQAQLAKQRQQMDPAAAQKSSEAASTVEYDVDVRETGQRKTIAGADTREVALTLTMRAKGQTLEEGGGLVATSTMWLAPRVAALEELTAFNVRFAKALFGSSSGGMSPQQMNALSALLPGIGTVMSRVSEETTKLEGTPLSTTLLIESVKSAADMSAAAAPPSGGGGLGGMLGARLMRGRGQAQARSTVMTATTETLSIAMSATDADVALPADFRLRN